MKRYLIFFLLSAILLAACQGNDISPQDKPHIISKDYISVPLSVQVPADGQPAELHITAECMWTISVSEDWLVVSPMAGNNSQQVTVSAEKNATGQERTATLTITGENALSRKVIVTQPSVTETIETRKLAVSPQELVFQAAGETKYLTIVSNTSWSANGPDWCVISPTSGTGEKMIAVTVGESPDTEQRTGTITINGEGVSPTTVSLTQEGKVEDPTRKPNANDNQPPA